MTQLDPSNRFDVAAATYHRARPGYPPAAIERLLEIAGVGAGDAVLDLGAGTGLLSERLGARGSRVYALEPNERMRSGLSRIPGIEAIDGTAERIDLPDGAVRLATAAQAYHWFEPARALPEIHRVLEPGGFLAVVWIVPDLEDPLQRRIGELTESLIERNPTHSGPLPGEELAWEPWFETAASFDDSFSTELPAGGLPELVASFSVVANLEPDERARTIEDAAGWVDGTEPLSLPHRLEVHLGRRAG